MGLIEIEAERKKRRWDGLVLIWMIHTQLAWRGESFPRKNAGVGQVTAAAASEMGFCSAGRPLTDCVAPIPVANRAVRVT